MDRSLAARLGRPLGLPVGPSRPRTGRRGPAPTRRPARSAPRRGLAARRLVGSVGAPLTLLRVHRRTRIALLAVLIASPILGGGWLWFRDSPLVAVEHVQLSGVTGPEAGAVEAALTGAARRTSTLDVHSAALLAAAAPLRVVREVHAVARFPHGLSIHVIEQLPVAALTVGAQRTAVAADGAVLGSALLTSALPALSASYQSVTATRVTNGNVLAWLSVLGAAPAPLGGLIARAYTGPQGLTLAMRNGLLVYFGDATRPHAKWLALARVLADPSSAGAAYVDVRLPERPAAGFASGVTPPAQGASGTAAAGSEQAPASEESTVAALAAGLSSAGGASSASAGASTANGTESEGSPSSAEQATTATPEQAAGGGGAPAQGTQAEAGRGEPAAGG
jgi:cell division protein FtsQ